MNDFYTYAYLREDRTPYYIGKGKYKNSKKYFRAYYGKHRVPIPPKERILILKDNLNEDIAFKHEKYMIDVYGRKNINTGILLNLTNGGEGFSGFKLTEERKNNISKRMKEYNEKNGNPNLKKYLIINVTGEYYIIDNGFEQFCKDKNVPYEAIRKKKYRGSTTPTTCGWSYFNITDRTKNEVDLIKNNFILKYKIDDNTGLKIETIHRQVSKRSVVIVLNFIHSKIKMESEKLIEYNGNKFLKISMEDFKPLEISTKTLTRGIKTLEENNILKIKKLNKNNFDQSNYYSL